MSAPQIIRTIEQLDALDPDTYLVNSDQVVMHTFDWVDDYNIDPTDMFPLAVIASGEQVRAACKALEKEQV